MKDYLPSNCGNWNQNNAELKNSSILDSFILNTRSADLLKADGAITMQWYSDIGHYQRGHLHLDISGVDRISLTSTKGGPGIGFNELKGQFITTGIMIPKSVENSLMTTNNLILFASRYSVEVPLELDKWVTLEIKDFSKVICRNESTTTPTTTTEVITETTIQTSTTPSTPTTLSTSQSTERTTISTQFTASEAISTTTPMTSTSKKEVTSVSTATTLTTISSTTSQTNDTKEGNPTNESEGLKILVIIVLFVIVFSVLLGIVISVVYYMNVKSKKREKDITIKVMPSNKNSRFRKSVDKRSSSGAVLPTATTSTIMTVKTDE